MAKRIRSKGKPKKIVYIIGSGATQAEISHKGGLALNLLMTDNKKYGHGICRRIFENTDINKKLKITNIEDVDIEKLITLLAATGRENNIRIANVLREGYFNEIVRGLIQTEIINDPCLAMCLMEMHKDVNFQTIEVLSGIISLNHDNLFQIASEKIHNCVDLGFKFKSKFINYNCNGNPLIIQLHGSFNWKHNIPIEVVELTTTSKYDSNILWIPPTILKESKEYPYNKLMGLAFETISRECDILRIVGCSLSQNDWNLISLIFNAQYFQYKNNAGNCFKIEIILSNKRGEKIKKDYPYLKNIFPIGYLTDGDFSDYKDSDDKNMVPLPSAMDNIFKYWLQTKAQFHNKQKEIDTSTYDMLMNRMDS